MDNISNGWILTTQIISLVVFVLALFTVYRLLVANKDSVIELLRERIASLEKQNSELEKQSADALAESLSDRVKRQLDEIERLREDGSAHQDEIARREAELQETRERLEALAEIITDAELVCPECAAPLIERETYFISSHIGDKEIEVDVEQTTYECGLTINHNGEVSPCKHRVKP